MSCSSETGKGRKLNHKAMYYNVISSHSPCVSLSPSSHHVSVFIPGMLLYFVLLPRASPVSRSIFYTMHLHHPRTVAYPMHTMHALSLFLSRRRACFFLLRQSLSLSIRLTKRSHSRGKQKNTLWTTDSSFNTIAACLSLSRPNSSPSVVSFTTVLACHLHLGQRYFTVRGPLTMPNVDAF
jgi:hypothetical protein